MRTQVARGGQTRTQLVAKGGRRPGEGPVLKEVRGYRPKNGRVLGRVPSRYGWETCLLGVKCPLAHSCLYSTIVDMEAVIPTILAARSEVWHLPKRINVRRKTRSRGLLSPSRSMNLDSNLGRENSTVIKSYLYMQ